MTKILKIKVKSKKYLFIKTNILKDIINQHTMQRNSHNKRLTEKIVNHSSYQNYHK